MSTAPASPPRWVDDKEGLDALVAELRDAPAYALDTEFHRERTYFPHLALVQLAWSTGDHTTPEIALVDPLALDLTPLAEILTGPGLAVLHAAEQDLEVLDRATGTIPSRLFDTQVAAGFVGFSSPSLSTLSERFLSIRLPKGDRLTDWTRRPLTRDQMTYAAADVAHLLDLHQRLVAQLDERGRREWAEAECEILRVRAPRSNHDPMTAWWRLKDGRSLRGGARGVAQELAAWRERRAAQMDLPTRFVLSDMALLGVVHRKPTRNEDLDDIRGLDTRQLRAGAREEVLAAVARGIDLDPAELRVAPADEVDRTLRPAVTLVSAWVAQLGRDLEVDPTLLATRSDVQALLRGDADARLAEGWRAELVGVPVRQLVQGHAALAFSGDNLVLERRSGSPLLPG